MGHKRRAKVLRFVVCLVLIFVTMVILAPKAY